MTCLLLIAAQFVGVSTGLAVVPAMAHLVAPPPEDFGS